MVMNIDYIIASIITGSATLAVGFISVYNAREARRTARRTHDIVSGNGKGDLSAMMESMLDWQLEHERQDRQRFNKVDRELRKVNKALDQAEVLPRSDSRSNPRHASSSRGTSGSPVVDRTIHSGEVQ